MQLSTLSGTRHQDCSFNKETLHNQVYTALIFNNCSFDEISWNNATFNQCHFVNCSFTQCQFDTTNLQDCNFYQCGFTRSHLGIHSENVLLQNCQFDQIIFLGPQNNLKILKGSLIQPDFTKAHFNNTHFYDLSFDATRFPWGHMQNITFDQCHFKGLNAAQQSLQQITFSRCRLEQADFTQAKLLASGFNESVLKHVNFSGIYSDTLQCVNCALEDVTFIDACSEQASIFIGSKLIKSAFNDAQLHITSFEAAHLYDIDFSGIKTLSFNLNQAHLKNVNFKNAELNNPENNFTQFENITWDNKAQEKLLTALSAEARALQEFHY